MCWSTQVFVVLGVLAAAGWGELVGLIPEPFKSVSLMAIGGALWAFYIHWRGRTFQKKLLVDIETSSKAVGDKRLLFIEVKLTNAGRGKLEAKRTAPNEYVYRDESEALRFSCSLQLKRLNREKLKGDTLLDWYGCPALEPIPDIPAEINLLDEYLCPGEGNKTIFWMEPGDVVHLPAALILTQGYFLLKVSFYGTVPKSDFWSRTVGIQLE